MRHFTASNLKGLVAFVSSLLLCMSAAPAMAEDTVILAGNLITTAESETSGPATITVTEGVITAIVPGLQRPADNSIVIDLRKNCSARFD